jgi:hypothetical protein
MTHRAQSGRKRSRALSLLCTGLVAAAVLLQAAGASPAATNIPSLPSHPTATLMLQRQSHLLSRLSSFERVTHHSSSPLKSSSSLFSVDTADSVAADEAEAAEHGVFPRELQVTVNAFGKEFKLHLHKNEKVVAEGYQYIESVSNEEANKQRVRRVLRIRIV